MAPGRPQVNPQCSRNLCIETLQKMYSLNQEEIGSRHTFSYITTR
jgi:hypothetical protein